MTPTRPARSPGGVLAGRSAWSQPSWSDPGMALPPPKEPYTQRTHAHWSRLHQTSGGPVPTGPTCRGRRNGTRRARNPADPGTEDLAADTGAPAGAPAPVGDPAACGRKGHGAGPLKGAVRTSPTRSVGRERAGRRPSGSRGIRPRSAGLRRLWTPKCTRRRRKGRAKAALPCGKK